MDPVQDARWLAAKNNDAGEMPAFAVAVVASSGTEGQFVLTKPTANGEHAWIAGAVPVLAGDGAQVTNDFPAWALYDDGDGTPAVGEEWGAGASSWKLRKGKTGFRICGTPDTTLKVVPVERKPAGGSGLTIGTATLAADYTIVATTGVPEDSGLSITLPSAGYYLIGLDIAYSWNVSAAGPSYITVGLRDSSNLYLGNSTGDDTWPAASIFFSGSGSFWHNGPAYFYRALSGVTLYLYVEKHGGTWTSGKILTNYFGKETQLRYARLGD